MTRCLTQRERWNLFVITIVLCSAILPSLWFLYFKGLPRFLLCEAGLYETFAAFSCLASGVLFIIAFKSSKNENSRKRNPWLLFFGIACILLAAEELNWGQHLIGFNTPSRVAGINYQKEFNLHNLTLIQPNNNALSRIGIKLLIIYLSFLPVFLAIFPTIHRCIIHLRLPIPSLTIALAVWIAKSADFINYKVIYGNLFTKDTLHVGEAFESNIEFCLLLLAVEFLFVKKHNKTATKHEFANIRNTEKSNELFQRKP